MQEQDLSKEKLLQELESLRKRNAELEEAQAQKESLKPSITPFLTVLERSPLSTAVYSPDGSVVMINKALIENWQLSAKGQQFYQQEYNLLKDKQFEEKGVSPFINKGFTGEIATFPAVEYNIQKTNFRSYSSVDILWLQGFLYPIFDETGQLKKVVVIYNDMSASKQAEVKLKETSQKLLEERQIFISGPTVVFKWKNAPGWPVEYVSPNVKEVFGYSAEEFLNQEVSYAEIIPESDIERVGEEVQRANESGKSNFEHEAYRAIHKNGGIIWLYDFTTILRTPDGEITHYLGSVTNITERKLAEEQYRSITEDVLEHLDVGIMILDSDFKVAWINRVLEDFFGIKREEALGVDKRKLVHYSLKHLFENPSEFTKKLLSAYQNDKEIVRFDCHILAQNNIEERWLEYWSRPVLNGLYTGGRMELYYDITQLKKADKERKSLEAQILHAQKLESLGVLAGGIAHDFNNLLTGILGNAGLAKMELAKGSELINNISDIEAAAIRAAELCKQMLAYSGKGKFNISAINLNKVIKEMTHLLEISISKNIRLKFRLAPELPIIRADAVQIRQIIMNLITNASDAMGSARGKITIKTGMMKCEKEDLQESYLDDNLPPGTYIFAEISDTGCGISKENRQKIFDPFFTTKFAGRGLGLAAVLGIIRGHQGAIKLYSKINKGTTFKILLPCENELDEIPSDESIDIRELGGFGTVLVVDDEKVVRDVAFQTLEKNGFKVELACDGLEAIENFKKNQNKIILVLLDLTMPKMDGKATLKALKEIRSDITILLSSGYNEEFTTNASEQKEISGFIQKPYSPKELLQRVYNILDKNA